MEGEGDGPLLHELIGRTLLRCYNPVVAHTLTLGLGDNGGVVGVENHLTLLGHEVTLVGGGIGIGLVGIVEDDAEITHATHTGLAAHRGLAVLKTGIAEHTFLTLHPLVVEVYLLVRARRYALTPSAATVLVDEYHAVLALIDSAGGTARDAGRVEAVLAEARHIEHERALEGLEARGVDVLEVRVALALIKSSGEVVLPVWTVLDLVHLLARNHGEGTGRGRCLQPPLALQRGEVEGERLVVIVDLWQIRVGEEL